jgi:hypothetical protein
MEIKCTFCGRTEESMRSNIPQWFYVNECNRCRKPLCNFCGESGSFQYFPFVEGHFCKPCYEVESRNAKEKFEEKWRKEAKIEYEHKANSEW